MLDLRYEARDIDQSITSPEKVDQWFEAKTRGLSDLARAQVKRRWGTIQKVLSARDRLSKIVGDILLDMETRPRLVNGRGNAMLVCDSITAACRVYEMLEETPLKGRCAIVTSYKPSPADIKGEESGEGATERLLRHKVYRRMLAEYFQEPEDKAINKVEQFEKEVKRRFVNEPGQTKLLIVVDKLLTGFDAPSATYLYIDKTMRDHGLFQAICRVNRLDGEDKEYGYIIDYRDLFKSLERSIKDYMGEAFDGYDREDVEGLLKDRLEQGRARLEEVRETLKALCEPVEPPRDTAAYLRYFCAAESGNADQLEDNEPKRVQLYKFTAAFVRAYANLANEMMEAGYTTEEARRIRAEVEHCEKVRQEVRLASGDYVDMKMFEPAMRHLLDTYIRAEESEKLSAFDDLSLIELVVNRGEDAIESLPEGIRTNPEAVAETIENNVRRLIVDEAPVNPKYFEKMSKLLDELIEERRRQAIAYKEYLRRIVELTKKVKSRDDGGRYPDAIRTPALRAIYDNLDGASVAGEPVERGWGRAHLAVELDQEIRKVKKADWRGNRFKEREVRGAIRKILADNPELVEKLFEIVKHQREY